MYRILQSENTYVHVLPHEGHNNNDIFVRRSQSLIILMYMMLQRENTYVHVLPHEGHNNNEIFVGDPRDYTYV